MDSTSHWILFFSAALAINLSPGPDMIYILSKTIARGRKIGMASSLGVCTGGLVHALAAALGLSAILATSATAFTVVKYIGAAYLIYLGVKALVSKDSSFQLREGGTAAVTPWRAYKQGILVDILNPKVAVFFIGLSTAIRPPRTGALRGANSRPGRDRCFVGHTDRIFCRLPGRKGHGFSTQQPLGRRLARPRLRNRARGPGHPPRLDRQPAGLSPNSVIQAPRSNFPPAMSGGRPGILCQHNKQQEHRRVHSYCGLDRLGQLGLTGPLAKKNIDSPELLLHV